jgi:hypothetical protein
MNNTSSLKKVINALNQGTSVPALKLVRQNPEFAAVISKLVRSKDPVHFDKTKSNSVYNLDQSKLQEISSTVQDRIADTENMMQLFPDLELAAQIIISSILSPKDMVNTELIYTLKDSSIPSSLAMKITEKIKDMCEKKYKITQLLPDILREVLFESGSHIRAVIPESSVDELINNNTRISTEQLSDLFTKKKELVPLGILGAAKRPTSEPRSALESFSNFERLPYQHYEPGINVAVEGAASQPLNVDVTDNYMVLKLPKLIQANNRAKVREHLGRNHRPGFAFETFRTAMESGSALNERELQAIMYKGSQAGARPFADVKTQHMTKRKSVGAPLVMKIPSEATIPVHVPGDPKSHIGYFVLIDEEGNPVSRNSAMNALGMMSSNFSSQNSSHSLTSTLLARARRNLASNDNKNLTLDQAAKIYSDIVESDLVERLKNGIYGSGAQIAKNDDVYRIMMARTFANQYTRLLYIPVELVTYFAYKYYDNGIGKSMLDDLKILTSLRSILLFAKVMAMAKNSINVTHVNMTLDPNDPDPQKSIEESIHEVIRMRQQYFPLGINSPNDLVDWVQRAGIEFSFEGHPGIPQTKFDFDNKTLNHQIPDNDLDELLRKQTLMAIGLSPETVDAGFTAEFAVTVVKNNILLSKRVLQIQQIFTPQVTDNVQKIVLNDHEIIDEVINIFTESEGVLEKALTEEEKAALIEDKAKFYREFAEVVVSSLDVDLPKPDITTLDNLSQSFDEYQSALDKALEAWVNTDILNENVAGELNGSVDVIKQTLRAYFLRKWMSENGFMPELSDIVSTDEDNKPMINIESMMTAHVEGLTLTSLEYLNKLKANKDAATKDMQTLNAESVEATGGGDTSSSTDEMNTGTNDDLGGGFDLGGDFNMDEDTDNTGSEETTETTDNAQTSEEPTSDKTE